MTRCILHADADRFFYSVEVLDRPDLASEDRPVVIGHDPREHPRGIVTTANDAARRLGIDSGMSAARALRLAPNALFIAPRHGLYRTYSQRLMAALGARTPALQQLSIDEAWLDWAHYGFDPGPAAALRQEVLQEVGLPITVGVGTSKLIAKMATAAAKAQGESVRLVRPGGERDFLDPLPLRALPGVGPKTAERLESLGCSTIGQLARLPDGNLATLLGSGRASEISLHSRGVDESPLEPERERKSYSAEHTFQQDTRARTQLVAVLRRQAAHVAGRLRLEGLRAREVGLKLRYGDWTQLTRQALFSVAVDDEETLAAIAEELLQRNWEPNRPLRLIGLRAGRLSHADLPAQLPIPGL